MRVELTTLLLLFFLLAAASIYDIAARRIPNGLILVGIALGIVVSLGNHAYSPQGVAASLFGILTGLFIMLPFYALGAMGAGDAKLMAAVGAFLGPTQVTGAALLTFVVGGALSLIAAIARGAMPQVLSNIRLIGLVLATRHAGGLSLQDVQTTGRLPYALAIAGGTALHIWLAATANWPFV